MCYSILSCSSSSRHYRPCALQQAAPHRQLGPFRLPLLVDHIIYTLQASVCGTFYGRWGVVQPRTCWSCKNGCARAVATCVVTGLYVWQASSWNHLHCIIMEPFALHHHGTICTACTAVAVTKRQVTECHVVLLMSLCPTLGKLHCTAPTQPFLCWATRGETPT